MKKSEWTFWWIDDHWREEQQWALFSLSYHLDVSYMTKTSTWLMYNSKAKKKHYIYIYHTHVNTSSGSCFFLSLCLKQRNTHAHTRMKTFQWSAKCLLRGDTPDAYQPEKSSPHGPPHLCLCSFIMGLQATRMEDHKACQTANVYEQPVAKCFFRNHCEKIPRDFYIKEGVSRLTDVGSTVYREYVSQSSVDIDPPPKSPLKAFCFGSPHGWLGYFTHRNCECSVKWRLGIFHIFASSCAWLFVNVCPAIHGWIILSVFCPSSKVSRDPAHL